MTFEQNPEGRGGEGHEGIWVKDIPGRGDSTDKVPEVRMCLACSGNSKEARVAGVEPAVGEQ